VRPVRLHVEAEAEVAVTAEWYDDRQEGLGELYLAAVREALTTLQDPEVHPTVEGLPLGLARSASVKGFPYRVVFTELGRVLFVIAVPHDRQRPRYWSNRL